MRHREGWSPRLIGACAVLAFGITGPPPNRGRRRHRRRALGACRPRCGRRRRWEATSSPSGTLHSTFSRGPAHVIADRGRRPRGLGLLADGRRRFPGPLHAPAGPVTRDAAAGHDVGCRGSQRRAGLHVQPGAAAGAGKQFRGGDPRHAACRGPAAGLRPHPTGAVPGGAHDRDQFKHSGSGAVRPRRWDGGHPGVGRLHRNGRHHRLQQLGGVDDDADRPAHPARHLRDAEQPPRWRLARLRAIAPRQRGAEPGLRPVARAASWRDPRRQDRARPHIGRSQHHRLDPGGRARLPGGGGRGGRPDGRQAGGSLRFGFTMLWPRPEAPAGATAEPAAGAKLER